MPPEGPPPLGYCDTRALSGTQRIVERPRQLTAASVPTNSGTVLARGSHDVSRPCAGIVTRCTTARSFELSEPRSATASSTRPGRDVKYFHDVLAGVSVKQCVDGARVLMAEHRRTHLSRKGSARVASGAASQARISGTVLLVLSQLPYVVTFMPSTCCIVSMSSVTLRPGMRI